MSGAGPKTGALYALASAALFGASTPLSKLLLARIDPWMLAGLLYLGAGLGLFAFRLIRGRVAGESTRSLSRSEWFWLSGAIAAGGVAAPILMMYGLAATSAASVSLLLNLEAVFTAILAWSVFRESTDRRVAMGLGFIVVGAVVLSWRGSVAFGGAMGPIAIAGACLLWALDNNFTRNVALADPVRIVTIKGVVAGATNIALASALGANLPGIDEIAVAGTVGFFGYGVSLVLFVVALRHVGTARTGAYFATAPFVGAALSVVVLAEPVTVALIVAGSLMAVGTWLHLTERHEHEHEHKPTVHEHEHVHDEHHRHKHAPGDPPAEPHTHVHRHARIRHRHPHYPDAHHLHGH